MATPSLSQARSHYNRQRRISAAALVAVRRLFQRRAPLLEIASTVSAYQLASASASAQSVAAFAGDIAPLTAPAAFAGVSSAGFPITEPIIATIDRFIPAPVEPLPDAWWADAVEFMGAVEQLIVSEVQDAGRAASQVEMTARPDWTNYVRMLNPPSCARCAILAGRIYRDLDAFQRHPLCDCVMVPVTSWQDAHDEGLIVSPATLLERGQLRGLSKADERAVRDGADLGEVVNATGGTSAPGITKGYRTDLFGHRVKATHYGTTKRSAWRKANPSRLVRLRPETIYDIARDHSDAIRLLRLYGYLK
ncbi:hypothetical protein FB382_004404 [Nocardioides ginsengisegetis]|uniref:Phage Mu protein F like protein n=1 Tax=Nocardioides ginsengisegetis TaxID=661491 RepID=A0A7W3J495_9ACTN|nr:hypothetical protein [Nocardioides ginsengisegetis]MBA8806035.1 hypothetical protein [Nocardioides ginsengisegetis]MBA8806052.1 hypothetical protein [Nocardioides ginsengisegetis]